MITAKKESFFWTFLEYCTYAFFVLYPFVNYGSYLYTGSTTRAINIILTSILFGIGFACWLFRKKSYITFTVSPIFIAILVYFLSLFISSLVGLDLTTSFWSVATRMTGLWYFIHLGLFMIFLSAVIINSARHTRLITLIVFSIAFYSVLSFLGPEGIGFLFKGYPRDGFTFGNSSFAGMYIFGSFLLSLYYLYQSEVKKWWMYLLPFLILINPNIINRDVWFGQFSQGIAGEARASSYVIALSLIGIVFIWLISKIKDRKIKSRVSYSLFGMGILIMVVAAFSLLSPEGYLRKVYLSQSTAARPLVWEISQKSIAQHPLLGWGTDNFERAFEINYDNRLLQQEYGNEAWFDRAHNVFIDQLVDNGFIGLGVYILVYIVIIFSLLYTTLNAEGKNDRVFASLLIIYFTLHLMELQTAFDTSISYVMVVFMIVSAAVLLYRTLEPKNKKYSLVIQGKSKYVIAVVLLIFFSWSLVKGAIPFIRAQITNGAIRTAGSPEKRIPMYDTLLASPVDPHALLWRTATDFQRGIAENPKVLEDPKKVAALKKEMVILEEGYRKYIEEYPQHFRARLNLADILIYQRLFGIDKLAEAQQVLDSAITLVPQSPQSYWMKAVGYIYMKKFDLAKEYAKKAYDLNPKIVESENIVKYVDTSIKNFPDIDLYFFRQI